jgi:nucleotide-binding universal stress UspA family protein
LKGQQPSNRRAVKTVPKDDGDRDEEQTIVVGIDGSEHSRWALKWAADEAKRRGSLLRIVYAQISTPKDVPAWYEPGSTDLSPAEAIIDDAVGLVATRHPTVLARGQVEEWPASLVLTIASRSADLLVVGARGLGGFKELLLGSVSDQCVEYAHCPVAVVRSDVDELPLRAAEARIVVGIDGSLGSTRALRWTLEEAQIRSATVEGIYAWQYPPVGAFVLGPIQGFEAVAEETVKAATEYAEKVAPEVRFTAHTCFNAEVPALLDAAKGADLLVVGSKGHGGFHDALLGSIAHQCIRHAKCPVIVARPQLPEEHSEGTTPQRGGSIRAMADESPATSDRVSLAEVPQ